MRNDQIVEALFKELANRLKVTILYGFMPHAFLLLQAQAAECIQVLSEGFELMRFWGAGYNQLNQLEEVQVADIVMFIIHAHSNTLEIDMLLGGRDSVLLGQVLGVQSVMPVVEAVFAVLVRPLLLHPIQEMLWQVVGLRVRHFLPQNLELLGLEIVQFGMIVGSWKLVAIN